MPLKPPPFFQHFPLPRRHPLAATKSTVDLHPLKMVSSLDTLADPCLKLLVGTRDEFDLERLGLCNHACGNRVTLDRIENGTCLEVVCFTDVERKDETTEDGVKLAIGKMCTRAHPSSGTVAIVLRACADLINTHESFGVEVHGAREVLRVVVSCPHVLITTLADMRMKPRGIRTIKKGVPAGMVAPLYTMGLVL